MKPKDFPAAKLDLIAAKSAEELRAFISSIPLKERLSAMSAIHVPGFRENSSAGLDQRVRRFVADLHATGKPREEALRHYPRVWRTWVLSNQALVEAIGDFDNSADFVDNKNGAPPNTEADIAAFEHLARQSADGQVSREAIRTFYEFGYFLPDERIEAHISDARPQTDLQLFQQIRPIPGAVADLRQEVASFTEVLESQRVDLSQLRTDLGKQGTALEQQRTDLQSLRQTLDKRILAIESRPVVPPEYEREMRTLRESVADVQATVTAGVDRIGELQTVLAETRRDAEEGLARLEGGLVEIERTLQRLTGEYDLRLDELSRTARASGSTDLLEIEDLGDPSTHVLDSVVPAAAECLVDNLRAVGMTVASARATAREVLGGLHAGQLVMFSGSVGALVSTVCAATVSGRRYLRVRIPVGLLDGAELGRILRRAALEANAEGSIAVVLEGINRSAPEAYCGHLEALLQERLLGGGDGVYLLGSLVEGESALAITSHLCSFGPILDTDLLGWSEGKPSRERRTAMLSSAAFAAWRGTAATEPVMSEDLRALRDACQGASNALWRRVGRKALQGLIAAGCGDDIDQSFCFGWLLPHALAAGVSLTEDPPALLGELGSRDKRIANFLIEQGAAEQDA